MASDAADHRAAVLDAYIIEDLKRQEEARRRAEEERRPLVHIDPAPDSPAPEIDDSERDEDAFEDVVIRI